MSRQNRPWSAEETLIVHSTVTGALTILDMIDMLHPARSIHAIRRKYATHGNPDEDVRFRRATELGSIAYARACAEIGGTWK